MNYIKNNYKNWIILLIGIIILAFGSYIIITANIGGDSITVFIQGLENSFKITYGQAYLLGNGIFLIFVVIFHRKKIGIGTVLTATLTGLIIDVYLKYLPLQKLDNTFFNILFSFSGLVIASFGLTLYIYSKSGLGPFEAFIDYFSKKFNVRFGLIKIILDALLFITGIILGGKFGITSIVSVFVSGPLIDFFTFLIKKTKLLNTPKKETPSSAANDL